MKPGFSTKDDVTEFSGRGVGLDVVKSNIERVGGEVTMESEPGVGTTIRLKIPLTLAIIPCLKVAVGDSMYSLPAGSVIETFKAQSGLVTADADGKETVSLRDGSYPLVRLRQALGEQTSRPSNGKGVFILTMAGGQEVCLGADAIVEKFQAVVKPVPQYLNQFGLKKYGVTGCTILSDGNVSFILNIADLVK